MTYIDLDYMYKEHQPNFDGGQVVGNRHMIERLIINY